MNFICGLIAGPHLCGSLVCAEQCIVLQDITTTPAHTVVSDVLLAHISLSLDRIIALPVLETPPQTLMVLPMLLSARVRQCHFKKFN